jgi:hypothetical protein
MCLIINYKNNVALAHCKCFTKNAYLKSIIMKFIFFVILFLLYGSLFAQENNTDSIKPQFVAIRLNYSMNAAYLNRIDDSSVTYSYLKTAYGAIGQQNKKINYSDITHMTVNKKGIVGKSALIGLLIGAGAGAIIGLASGDDTSGWFRLTAGEKAAGWAILLGGSGSLVGLISGLTKVKKYKVDRNKERFEQAQALILERMQ